MNVFQQLRKDFAVFGIATQQHPFNWRNLVALFIFSSAIISNGVHILFEAKTFEEYVESIFLATAIITDTISFLYIVSIMQQFFNWMNESEKVINASEFVSFLFLRQQ